MRGVYVAFIDLMSGRMRLAEEFSRRGYGSLDMRDVLILMHIACYTDRGTRQQHLIDTLAIPRRTIRGKLDRLEQVGLLVRDGPLYFPAPIVGKIDDYWLETTLKEIGKLGEAWIAYRNASRRITPM